MKEFIKNNDVKVVFDEGDKATKSLILDQCASAKLHKDKLVLFIGESVLRDNKMVLDFKYAMIFNKELNVEGYSYIKKAKLDETGAEKPERNWSNVIRKFETLPKYMKELITGATYYYNRVFIVDGFENIESFLKDTEYEDMSFMFRVLPLKFIWDKTKDKVIEALKDKNSAFRKNVLYVKNHKNGFNIFISDILTSNILFEDGIEGIMDYFLEKVKDPEQTVQIFNSFKKLEDRSLSKVYDGYKMDYIGFLGYATNGLSYYVDKIEEALFDFFNNNPTEKQLQQARDILYNLEDKYGVGGNYNTYKYILKMISNGEDLGVENIYSTLNAESQKKASFAYNPFGHLCSSFTIEEVPILGLVDIEGKGDYHVK